MRRVSPEPTRVVEVDLPFTPQAITNLRAAVNESRRAGTGQAVGAESIFLAMMRDEHTIPAQILAEMGVHQEAVRRVEETMGSQGYRTGSNMVVNRQGKQIGFMWKGDDGTPFVGDAEGNPIQVTDEMLREE